MQLKSKFFGLWEQRQEADSNVERERIEGEMASVVRDYVRSKYSFLENDHEKVIRVKEDFESEIPPRVLADALGIETDLCRRYRYHGAGRGVIDTRPDSGSRDSIPPSVRDEIEDRDDGQCVKCGSEEDLTLHHIVPLNQGGTNSKSNYSTLCDTCHKQAHAGNFGSARMAYETKDEFWEDFCNE